MGGAKNLKLGGLHIISKISLKKLHARFQKWVFGLFTLIQFSCLLFFGLNLFWFFFGLVLMGAKKGVPGKVQNFAEFVFEFISGAVKTIFMELQK